MSDNLTAALIGLAGALIGAAASVLTTLVLARNERHRFAREKLWDTRREAYSRVMAHLAEAVVALTNLEEGYTKQGQNYLGGTTQRDLTEKYSQAMVAAKDTFLANRLVVSEEFAQRMKQLGDNLGEINARGGLSSVTVTDNRKALGRATAELWPIALSEVQRPRL